MEIKVKTTKLTKSKIQQMDYFCVPRNPNVEILGWVNYNKNKWVIIKIDEVYYRAEFITIVEKYKKSVQFSLSDGGYEYPELTNIKCSTFNRGQINYSLNRDDNENIKLYDRLVSFKRKTEIAGQIYY